MISIDVSNCAMINHIQIQAKSFKTCVHAHRVYLTVSIQIYYAVLSFLYYINTVIMTWYNNIMWDKYSVSRLGCNKNALK